MRPNTTAQVRYLMGTTVEIAVKSDSSDAALAAAFGEFERLERIFSRFDPESELTLLNRRKLF